MGRIGKLFGTDGGLTLSLYDAFPDEVNIEEPLWVVIDSLAVPLFADRFERRGRSGALVRFADIDTTQRAEEFVGHDLYMEPAEQEWNDGELYFEDLEGYAALIKEGESGRQAKGIISSYIDSEFNPLFAVETPSGEILIPASDDFIEEVDVDARSVTFSLPEGLSELNT